MISRLSTLFVRAKDVLQREGLEALLRRTLYFLLDPVFQYRTYYFYEYTLRDQNEADFIPRLNNLTYRIITTSREAGELADNESQFSPYVKRFKERLDKGAIAFYFFVDRELAHWGWVAMNQEAQDSLGGIPIKVDFTKQEAYTGASFTLPKYRGKSLMKYSYFKRLQFLKESGMVISRNAVAKDNVASHHALAKLSPRIYAKAQYLKLGRWQVWRESPFSQASQPD